MAYNMYRALSLRAPCIRISTLSNRGSSLLQALAANHPSRNGLSPPSSLFSTSTQLQTIDYIKDAVTIVGGSLGALVSAATFWKLVKTLKNTGSALRGVSLPPKPSHTFQPRTEEVRRLTVMFNTLEENNPGNVVNTIYITGEPATGKTQLAGEYGRKFFESNKNKKVFVGTLSNDNFLQNYLRMARDLGCVKEQTELDIRSGKLDEITSLNMLSDHVKEELKKNPKWLMIIDGLSLDERLVKEMSNFWPQPKEESWGKGYVLVTTQGHAPLGSCIDVMDLRGGMSQKDAVELVTRESGCNDKEGAVELVNSLDRSPLSVAWC